ncbi:MerR family transcriptional regulator [Planomicrobium sp. CPCC 101079]|uniref:MerR family transcriptional regulator n=1 Tax=Planomicrobium sp. CPCC 101079 TaxID=2599618 RepID=UPI0011B55917|nr:MerR family transcriptional regulator [Planomicrobium sp. CPCC 101079]TWT01626.1 MerR family transcriptional regulator [Planomicrobium sp. CPCC 101079]
MMIGTVAEITGLSERQIRYYEQKKLISPFRTATGNRKYSFSDIEKLIEIAEKVEEGVRTSEILEDLNRTEKSSISNKELIQGQINSHFRQSGKR